MPTTAMSRDAAPSLGRGDAMRCDVAGVRTISTSGTVMRSMQLSVPGHLPRMGPDSSVPVIKRVAGPWKRLTMRAPASAHLRGPQVGLLAAGSDIEDISCLWSGPTPCLSCAQPRMAIKSTITAHCRVTHQTRMRPCSISAASAHPLRNGIAPSGSSRIGIDCFRAASVRRATTHVTLAHLASAPQRHQLSILPILKKRSVIGATAMGFWEQGCAPPNY